MSTVNAEKSAKTFETLESTYGKATLRDWQHVWTKHLKMNPWPDINATLQQLYTEKGASITAAVVEDGLVARGWKQSFCHDCEHKAEARAKGLSLSVETPYTETEDTEMDSEDEPESAI